MSERGDDQVHTERLHQQDADHDVQTEHEGPDEDRHTTERGGALHRLAEKTSARERPDN